MYTYIKCSYYITKSALQFLALKELYVYSIDTNDIREESKVSDVIDNLRILFPKYITLMCFLC